MSEIQNVIWPGWEIVRRIGSGSFGTVYEMQRDVYGDIEKAALKVIKLPRSEDEVDYLRCTGLDDASITVNFHQQVGSIAREYKLMAQMRNNPNVVRCDDFRDIQHEDGLGWDIYIKMELLSPLMKNLDKVSTEPQIIQLGKDICNALISCQEKNIIHRDIKPQNVFVSEAGVFKLGDFGIARTMEHTTHATASIGTYSYMAPEVEKNQPYGKPADIYSLGLMLYWLLNERRGAFMPLPPAIPGYGDEETARQRRFSGEPIPEPKHGSDGLKSVVLKACAFHPNDRYQSAQEMYSALCALDDTAERTVGAAFIPVPVRPEISITEDGMTVGPRSAPVRMQEASPAPVAAPQTAAVYDDGMTVGPRSAPAQKQDAPPAPVAAPVHQAVAAAVHESVAPPVDAPAIDYGSDPTIGPTFKTVAEKKHAAVKKAEAPDKTETPQAEKPDPKKADQPQKTKKKKKSPVLFIILGAVATTVLLALLLIIPSCNNESSKPTPTLPPVVTTTPPATQATEPAKPTDAPDVTEAPKPTEAPEVTTTEPSVTEPQQLDWSEWSDTLPANVTKDNFDIEEKTLYSKKVLETTSSSNKTMAGWELYDTAVAGQGYGNWVDTKDKKPEQKSGREISTYTVYRYRTKQTTTSSSPSMSGWTQYGTPTYSWGSWSAWSTTKVTENTNRQVETRTEYRYRTVSGSGGYSAWGSWSQWQDTPVSENDLRQVETKTVSTKEYFYYQCNSCGLRWYTNKTPCSGCSSTSFTYRTGSNSLIMDPAPFMGSGYYQSNDGTGMVFMTSPNGTSKTQYRYRTRTKLPGSTGEWSAWGTTPYTSTGTREVESRTVYRHRSKSTTYTYYRWSDWSSWSTSAVSGNTNREVQTGTYYRYRDKVTTTTYLFRRWSDWSAYTDTEVAESDTVQVKTKKVYRYKSKTPA